MDLIDPSARFLCGQAFNVTSQFGEDGLIAVLLARIGTRNRWCFEVGAGDGKYLSNTWSLRAQGWTCLLIEQDLELWKQIGTAPGQQCVHSLCHKIGPDSLDKILAECGAPADLDFGVIDIDGQDYHVFAGLQKFRPRALLVEYNQQDAPVPDLGGGGQAGLTAILSLGRSKGYVPLVRTNVNVLFVAEPLEEAA